MSPTHHSFLGWVGLIAKGGLEGGWGSLLTQHFTLAGTNYSSSALQCLLTLQLLQCTVLYLDSA